MLAGQQLEPELREPRPEILRVVEKARAQVARLLEKIEHLETRSRDDRRNTVGKKIGPRALPQPADDRGPPRDVTAAPAAEGLAERPGENVHALFDARQFVRAAPAGAHEADGVRVVYHDERAVAIRQVADRLERREAPVHREHTVRRDHARARAGGIPQALFELGEVRIPVALAHRLREPDAVDDARVVERVADDDILLAEDGLEQPAVRIEAGRIQ